MNKVFKIDIDKNQLLKCVTKDCQTMRWKRTSECQPCKKSWSDKSNPKNNAIALNTYCKEWSVYRMKLDGYIYYGQTGTTLNRRASIHKSNAGRGKHKNSYIHQQIVARNLNIEDVENLMEILCIARSEEESLAIESHLIKRSILRGEKVCNSKYI